MAQLTTNQDLILNIQKTAGDRAGYISWKSIAEYLGISRNNKTQRDRITNGCRFIEDGRGKRYRIIDVAVKIRELEAVEITNWRALC